MSMLNARAPLGRFLSCFLSLQMALGSVGVAGAQTESAASAAPESAAAQSLPHVPSAACAVMVVRLQQALYDQFHLDEPWDSEHNRTLIAKMPLIFHDPSSGLAPEEGKSNYLGVAGDAMAFPESEQGRRIVEFLDGTSHTVNLVQVGNDQAVAWTKPEDWNFDEEAPLKGLVDSLHPGIFLAACRRTCEGDRR